MIVCTGVGVRFPYTIRKYIFIHKRFTPLNEDDTDHDQWMRRLLYHPKNTPLIIIFSLLEGMTNIIVYRLTAYLLNFEVNLDKK